MEFTKLAQYFEKLEKTASRNEMTEILSSLFEEADKDEIDKICYLAQGRIGPSFESLEIGMADKTVAEAIARAFKTTKKEALALYKEKGDMGIAAELLSSKFKVQISKLTVNEVFEVLTEIAKSAGKGTVEKRINLLSGLFSKLDSLSVRYLARIPLDKLRLGFSEMTILDALSYLLTKDKSQRGVIEEAYNIRADIGSIAKIVKTEGVSGLKNIKVLPGIPILPALCQRVDTPSEMMKKAKMAAVEPKYDGTRLQIHYEKGKPVKMFTRNLENVSESFPEIVEALETELAADNLILDGEAIGVDLKTGRFLAFQETIKRKRKYDIDRMRQEVPLRYFAFDILYKNGEELIKLPFSKRREILSQTLKSDNKIMLLSPQIVTDDPGVLRQYHDEQIKNGLEGVVVKKWDSSYEPGKRGYTWIKFKQEKGKKGGGLVDTLECVVMGYNKGRGKRADFGIGAFLVGVKKDEQFVTISKIGTGLSDEQWREMRQRCQRAATKEGVQPKEYVVAKNLIPDCWCLPEIVVEIEADNITISPSHTAGYALRFPRLVKFRDDKSPEQVTTLPEVKKLYETQPHFVRQRRTSRGKGIGDVEGE